MENKNTSRPGPEARGDRQTVVARLAKEIPLQGPPSVKDEKRAFLSGSRAGKRQKSIL